MKAWVVNQLEDYEPMYPIGYFLSELSAHRCAKEVFDAHNKECIEDDIDPYKFYLVKEIEIDEG